MRLALALALLCACSRADPRQEQARHEATVMGAMAHLAQLKASGAKRRQLCQTAEGLGISIPVDDAVEIIRRARELYACP